MSTPKARRTPASRSAQVIAPPHDLDAERSVLGAILLADRTMHHLTLESGLNDEDFYHERHRLVFAAMRSLYNASEPVDKLTLRDQLQREGTLETAGGQATIDSLYAAVANAGNALRYARIVREQATARRLLDATYNIQELIAGPRRDAGELIEEAERQIFELRSSQLPGRAALLENAVEDELERLRLAQNDGRDVPGLRIGISDLDRLLGGMHDGRLYVVAARPEIGKSLLVLQMALHAAIHERARTLFALLEMDDAETAQRYLAMESGVDPERLRLGKVKDEDWTPLLAAAGTAHTAPLHLLDDSHISLSSLRAHARQVAVRHGDLRLIVVDYLQLMHVEDSTGSRTTDVSNISRGLKIMAREFRCPVIAVSQLNREVEHRNDKRPMLSDLRETGAIEADADAVLMLYREDYYDPDSERPGEMDVIVQKNRRGKRGTVTLRQDKRLRHLPLAHAA
jgi:replicative DNA helicase